VTEDDLGLSLEEGMSLTGMTFEELWIRELELGGVAGILEVEAYVLGLLAPDSYQHDLLAQALNEWSLERGGDHPVGYWPAPRASGAGES
jgi:hypothetical protein